MLNIIYFQDVISNNHFRLAKAAQNATLPKTRLNQSKARLAQMTKKTEVIKMVGVKRKIKVAKIAKVAKKTKVAKIMVAEL